MLVLGIQAGHSLGNAHLHSCDISYNGDDVKPATIALLTTALQANRGRLAAIKGVSVCFAFIGCAIPPPTLAGSIRGVSLCVCVRFASLERSPLPTTSAPKPTPQPHGF